MLSLKMPKGRIAHPKATRTLFLLCWISYMVTYLGRLNYAACLVEIAATEGWAKGQLGLIATGFFLCYGLGQLANGYVGDRLAPKIMVGLGLFCSGIVNLLFPLAGSVFPAAALWCVNGFVQSMIWSPIVRQLSSWLPEEKRQQACVNMNATVPVGTLAVYGLSALMVLVSTWHAVFWISGTVLILMSVVWFTGISRLEKTLEPAEEEQESVAGTGACRGETLPFWKLILVSAMPLCMLGLFMQGILKDGITTWIPTFLEENFGLTASASILSTTIVPIVNLGGVYLASWLNRRYFRNEPLSAAVFFGTGLAVMLALTFLPVQAVGLSLGLLAAATTCMMGVNTLLASMMPHYYVRFGVCSTVTGMFNSAVYLGSAISSYGNGALVEHFGWHAVMLIWCVCAALGLIFCGCAGGVWKKFQGREAERRQALAGSRE